MCPSALAGGVAAPEGPCRHWAAQWIDDQGFVDGLAPNLPGAELTLDPTSREIDQAFGDDAELARAVCRDGFDSAGSQLALYEHVLAELGGTMIRSSSEGPPGYTFIDVFTPEPNVARDRRVKLPPVVREEREPPDAVYVVAILERLTRRWRLAFVTAEQTGMRVGEIAVVTWGDADIAGSRFRMRARATKSRRGKWVPVPSWLIDEIEASCPVEDRLADRKVFTKVDEAGLRMAMRRACQIAGIPVYSPHDLRHRRITIWHHAGVPMREIQERVGHSRASVTLDVYSHVMPVAEVTDDVLRGLLHRPREVPVRSEP